MAGCNTLPYSQTIVNVNISSATLLPILEGFGTLLFMTEEVGLGTGTPPDATTRTKYYATIDEVGVDYAVGTEPYNAALTIFGQNPSPLGFKVGFINAGETLADAIVAIHGVDCGFYGIAVEAPRRDVNQADILALAEWVSASDRVLGICTNDVNTETTGNAGHTAEVLQTANIANNFVFYADDVTLYPEVAYLTVALAHDFNNDNSYYTMKHKTLNGIATLNKSSAIVRAITGFVPGQGLDDTQGYFANAYVQVGGVNLSIEGQMTNGEFFDQVHLRHWLVNRVEVAILTEQKQASYIPYTDQGIAQLGAAVKRALDAAVRMGGVASPGLNDEGEIIPAYTLSLPRRVNQPAALRVQRVLSDIRFIAQLAGAIHYVTVNGTLTV